MDFQNEGAKIVLYLVSPGSTSMVGARGKTFRIYYYLLFIIYYSAPKDASLRFAKKSFINQQKSGGGHAPGPP